MNNLDYNKFKYFLFIFFLLFITKLSYSQEKNYLDSVIQRINDLESELRDIQSAKPNNLNNNDNYNFAITAKSLINTDDSSDLRLFVAPILGKVVYPGSYNGMYEHHNVIIEQLTGNSGKSIKFLANVDYTETFSWSIPSQWVDNTQLRWNSSTIKVIAWVQNYRTKEILQAADFTF